MMRVIGRSGISPNGEIHPTSVFPFFPILSHSTKSAELRQNVEKEAHLQGRPDLAQLSSMWSSSDSCLPLLSHCQHPLIIAP